MTDMSSIDTLIAGADTEFPALFQLFGGYFHEDWQAEYETPSDALSAFVAEAPPVAVREAAVEMQRLLQLPIGDDGLTRLLDDGFDCNYLPEEDGLTPSGWLRAVLERLQPHA